MILRLLISTAYFDYLRPMLKFNEKAKIIIQNAGFKQLVENPTWATSQSAVLMDLVIQYLNAFTNTDTLFSVFTQKYK